MKKLWTFTIACLLTIPAGAQTPGAADAFSAEEAAAVAALLANQAKEEAAAAQEKAQKDQIVLPEETKKEAQEQASSPAETKPADTAAETADEEKEDEKDGAAKGTCLTVAFVDIDVAFNEHPRTIAVKEQIREKILAKEDEVARAKDEIEIRTRENNLLAALVREIKPFYERIVVEPHPLLPRIEEPADTLELTNLLNHLTFAQAEVLSASPLDTPSQLEDILARIAENKRVIEERSFFIDNYKYATREEILKLEKEEVNEILKDIYQEIKSFAQKRNIGAIVRKDEILYGEKPVNVTPDFVNRLKKSKKYRKRGK